MVIVANKHTTIKDYHLVGNHLNRIGELLQVTVRGEGGSAQESLPILSYHCFVFVVIHKIPMSSYYTHGLLANTILVHVSTRTKHDKYESYPNTVNPRVDTVFHKRFLNIAYQKNNAVLVEKDVVQTELYNIVS